MAPATPGPEVINIENCVSACQRVCLRDAYRNPGLLPSTQNLALSIFKSGSGHGQVDDANNA